MSVEPEYTLTVFPGVAVPVRVITDPVVLVPEAGEVMIGATGADEELMIL